MLVLDIVPLGIALSIPFSNLMAHFEITLTTKRNFGEIKLVVGNVHRYTHVKIKLNIFACRQNHGATIYVKFKFTILDT